MRRRPDCEKEWQQANRRAGASEPATPNRKSPTAKKVFVKADGLGSLYGSTQNADDFNVHNAVYKQAQKIDGYIYPALTAAQP